MVAPCPLEPLVLYLAAIPYSASAALVAVQEEHHAAPPAEAMQYPEGTVRAKAMPTGDQA